MNKLSVLFVLGLFFICSCGKVRDHYSIVGVQVEIGKYVKSKSPSSIAIDKSSEITKEDTVVVKINFAREYYSTDTSPYQLKAVLEGWEGCLDSIESFRVGSLHSDSVIVFGDTSLRQIFDYVEGDSHYEPAISYSDVNSFKREFNFAIINPNSKFLGEETEYISLIFLAKGFRSDAEVEVVLKFNDLEPLKGKSNKLVFEN